MIKTNNHIEILRLSELQTNAASEKNYFHLTKYGFLYFTKGDGIIVIDFKDFEYQKGSLIMVSPKQLIDFQFEDNTEGFLVLFTENSISAEVFKTVRKNEMRSLKDKFLNEEALYGFILNLYKEIKNSKGLWNASIIQKQLEVILLKCDRCFIGHRKKFSEKYFNTYLHFNHLVVHEHMKSRNALDYAENLSLSYKHLNDICKKVTGITAKDYINEYLVLEIKKALVLTNIPINKLTTLYGFDEATNFVKYFKRYTLITPKQFRKENK